jgi:hypothetical protein
MCVPKNKGEKQKKMETGEKGRKEEILSLSLSLSLYL